MGKTWPAVLSGDGVVRGLGPYGQALTRLSLNLHPFTAPVDGGSARVISRYYGLAFARGEARKKPEVRAAVSALLSRSRSRTGLATVLALVDLGAVVCKPRNPDCRRCPLRSGCAYFVATR